jgi:SAM-dependent methyltransferase
MDPETFRQQSRESWESSAGAWEARADAFRDDTLPVSRWLVDHLGLQPGHVVLELAAGIGDTGFLAAELIKPGGRLISTDGAEAMVEAARRRGEALGIDNAEYRSMEAEWIDQSAASVDAVLSRWGYMLLADPEAALRETRRVLKPGGRLALAAWAPPQDNQWLTLPGKVTVDLGLREPPDPTDPGPFSFADPAHVEDLLGAAGFADVEVDHVDFPMTAPDLDTWWEHSTQMSHVMRQLIPALSPADHYALRDAFDAAFAPWVAPGGAVSIPARALVAAASA